MLFQQSAQSFLLLVLLMISITSAQEIHRGPENITVFLNQPANFTCEVTSGVTAWKVNTTSENELSPRIRANIKKTPPVATDRGNVVTLTINALADYNGTTFQCVTFGDFEDESEIVTMTIQGPVSAVGDLKVTESSTSIKISWTAPFSLDVTGVDPDIWYSVLIYKVTDENNPTAILCTDCINITETHYTFTPDHPSPCHAYHFTVIPFNGAGKGESSHSITGYTLENRNPSVDFIGPDTELFSDDQYLISFRTQGDTNSVCRYQFQSITGQNIEPYSENDTTITFKLGTNEKYAISVGIQNAANDTEIQLNFSTFDIQKASAVTSTDRKIAISAQFTSDTRARGVFIVFRCINKTCREFRAVQRPGPSTTVTNTITNLPPATYTVSFHDLEESGLPNISPAYEQSESVIVAAKGEEGERSSILEYASATYLNKSAGNIDCKFKQGVENASCVIVYYQVNVGEDMLKVVEYSQSTKFPVVIDTVDDSKRYTFAIFGKNSTHFDERPFMTELDNSGQGKTSNILGVAVGVTAIIVVITVVIALLFCYCRKRRMQNGNGEEHPPCPPWPPCPPRSIASGTGNGEVEKDGTITMDDNSNPMAPPEQRMKPMQHSIAADRIVTTDERSTRARLVESDIKPFLAQVHEPEGFYASSDRMGRQKDFSFSDEGTQPEPFQQLELRRRSSQREQTYPAW